MNAGEIIQGRYRLEQALGHGGMATVWRAEDLRLNRLVALKCLMPPLSEDPEYLVRFFAEAQQVARLSHPNVVRVLDFGQGEDFPYLVMEYLPGGSLAEVQMPMETGEAIEVIAGAARGAGAAHALGMVHRDLKPGNILLSEDGAPKVADFGIAVSRAQERLTATGTAIGSPHYVSPEQASGRPIEPPSDVYSLGVVLYELLTGERPFDHENVTALAIAHVEEEPQPPSVHDASLGWLDEVVMRCLAKDPQARFADGTEMAAALDRLRSNAGTAAFAPAMAAAAAAGPAEPDLTPASRNVRRTVSVAMLVAMFLGLLVAGVLALGGSEDPGRRVKPRAVGGVEKGSGSQDATEARNNNGGVDEASAENEGEASADAPAAEGTPTPTESPEVIDPDQEEAEVARETTEEKEPDEDPATEPTTAPTSEPTPEPTGEPVPEPTSTP